jgi:hypothetical protein
MPPVPSLESFLNTGAELLFYICIGIFALQSLFFAYHWFTYGSSKRISVTALAIYLSGGAVIFMILSLMLHAITL